MDAITSLITAVAPHYNGDAFVARYDRQARIADRKQLRKDLRSIYGRAALGMQYSVDTMKSIAKDRRFSAAAQRAASFFASPEGADALVRMNTRSGKKTDRKFGMNDLDAVTAQTERERNKFAKNSDEVAAAELEQTTRKLTDTFNQAVVSVMQRHTLNPPSTRIE